MSSTQENQRPAQATGNSSAAAGHAAADAGLGRLPADPQELAELTARTMYAGDAASQALGAAVDTVAPGQASMTMTVRRDMLNGHKTCHGGFIFALADSAFAFACNSRNDTTVASGASIDFLAPAFEGDVLTARALESSLAGRTGLYDVEVRNGQGKRIAMFRGRSYRIKGQVVPGEAAS